MCADEETLQRMLEAVAVQKAAPDWRMEEGRFIPHPARWLKNQGWLDGPCEALPPKHYENERDYVDAPPEKIPEWLKAEMAEDEEAKKGQAESLDENQKAPCRSGEPMRSG